MKASYRWLRALVPGLDASPRELADRFTSAGLEVEALSEFGAGTAQLVLAEVRKVEPHPSRAKLRLVTIDTGGGEQRVVCGAPNVPDPGGVVAFAPLGAHLPAVNMTLTPRDIGGVTSEGMLCSEHELGLVLGPGQRGGHDGILVYAAGKAKPGTPLRQGVPSVHDWVLDIAVTPNRPDALGHVGLAREAAALCELPFSFPDPAAPKRIAQGKGIDAFARVEIADTERCPIYAAAMVTQVKIGPSPDWLRYRLESLGVRAISNVVDVTNLVLLEFGQPMHAFDLERVRGARIEVRRAREGEELVTLDGTARKLDPDDLVIADGEGAVGLAGVMGGANSEIGAGTSRVLLECAHFTPRGIRRTARRHAMHTEASHRFERGVDPGAIPDVLAHAASLLTELAGGAAVPGSILAGPGVPPREAIRLRAARMNRLLGAAVPMRDARAILERLGCAVQGSGDDELAAVPPSHRPDLTMEADLVEEVVRVRGLDSIPTRLPAIAPQPPRQTGLLESRVRRAAVEVGLSEAVTYGFVSPREITALGAPRASITLKNPLGEERSVMRTTLVPGLLEALRRARRRGAPDCRLFTIGPRFLAARGETIAESPAAKRAPALGGLPDEVPSFAAVIAGSRAARLGKPEDVDVYDAKGAAAEIVERVTGRPVTVRAQSAAARSMHLHPRGAGELLVCGTFVGTFGPLHPNAADALGVEGPCMLIELDLRALDRAGTEVPQFVPIPALPAATRDIAVVVHDDVTAGAVAEAIREAGQELCESVELFDLFRGGNVPADHRSLAYHVVYRDPKAATEPEAARTLTDEEVDARHKAVVATVTGRFGATLRA